MSGAAAGAGAWLQPPANMFDAPSIVPSQHERSFARYY